MPRRRYPTRAEAALSTPVRIARKMLAVEEEYERRARDWARAGRIVTSEKLREMKEVAARRVLELDRETFEAAPNKRRALRPRAQRMRPLSLREAAHLMGVDAKSTRFIRRFIDKGRLSFERAGTRWVFDFAEFEKVKREENAAKGTDGRRKRAR